MRGKILSALHIFTQASFLRFSFVSVALYVLLHIAFVQLPPTGNHVWRQSNSLALAKNYFEEDMNITQPRVDKRYNQTGVTGANFPLYEWGLAVIYKLVGFSHTAHRVYALLITLLCFFLVYGIFKFQEESIARIASWVFLFNPLVFFYGFSALPDMMAILSLLAVNLLILKNTHKEHLVNYLLIGVTLAIGVMIKFTYVLWLGIPFLIMDSDRLKPFRWKLLFTAVLAIIPTALWYVHAKTLTDNSGGVIEFVYHARFIYSLDEFKQLFRGLISAVPEMLLGYPALVLGALFIYYKKEKIVKVHPFYKWSIALLTVAYFIAASHNLINHDYYLLPFLGLLLVGLARMPKKLPQWLLVFLMLLMPVWAALRIIPSNWAGADKNKYALEYEILASKIPKGERVICGIDPTGCYLFYMLGVKGFPYAIEGELNDHITKSDSRIGHWVSSGVRYLVTNNKRDLTNPVVANYIKEVEQVGEQLWLVRLE